MTGRILRPGDERDILAARFEIEKTETFHMKNFYEWFHDWLGEEDWVDTDAIGGDKWEHQYWEKRGQTGEREVRIWWRFQKFPANSEYFRWVFLTHFRYLKAKPIEIVHKGHKLDTWRGNLTMLNEAWLQVDYKNMWQDHWLMKHFDKLYRRRIWNKQIQKWKDDLWREAYVINNWLKAYLEMKTPYETPFHFNPQSGHHSPPDPRILSRNNNK